MTEIPETMRAVRFDEWGDRSVLHVAEVPVPEVAPGRVLVRVRAAGINPGESAIRQGVFGGDLPSGQGTDFAGIVVAVGAEVDGVDEGEEVLGWSWDRAGQAEYVAVPAVQVVQKPRLLDWAVAGGLDVVATTAAAAVRAVDPRPGETVVVSGAAGGVGGFVTQLLTNEGIDVIAIASESNHDWLRSKRARPVAYGDGLRERITELATNGVDAVIDTFGPEYVHLGIALGVPAERIETVIAFEAAAEVGARTAGSADTADPEILGALALQVADGSIEVPVAATFPLERVQDAYEQLEQRHTRGKIVLVP
ncbi:MULTISPECIES: NADP-dependent oxidoreductase [unclassified Curtobacterium]|uniref:NADP-dependent oxidoreductase n=1 Tax=unclassified Curtobacterium TaxID=257496 RepID=UPI0008DD514F|nr:MULTISPECIES: NADP-dependent oxidoreductase [unclassified Curtobacterium]OIH99513.1 NADPH:quinone reductase [Curtobacterium sp. MCBA15_003]OII11420.1 NADPH:quinone reductase [Curtobacterium sp. MCBA15_009]OII30654.1 NADPH:quinone reductase [Curtobacterium sp. MMLR14_006]